MLSLYNPSVPKWREILRKNFINFEKLAAFLELSSDQKEEILSNPQFPLNIPLRLAEKIEKRTLDDPILRQFLPLKVEKIVYPGFIEDPVGDQKCRLEPKLLHKYEGRVLIVCTSACAMHCRFCFRQNFAYDVSDENKKFEKEIQYIQNDKTIQEVILSGGDPLSLSDERLGQLLDQIGQISHVRRIRMHTRFPMGIPERIDENFLALLQEIPQKLFVVLHVNHPKELDHEVCLSIQRLQKQGVVLLSQSVLLKDVNDDILTLKALYEQLVDIGVVPYYLHQLDRVQGAMHFEVCEQTGKELIDQLMECLPGYAVPKYVKEISGEPSKTIIDLLRN